MDAERGAEPIGWIDCRMIPLANNMIAPSWSPVTRMWWATSSSTAPLHDLLGRTVSENAARYGLALAGRQHLRVEAQPLPDRDLLQSSCSTPSGRR